MNKYKSIIRKLFLAREKESVRDAIHRHKINIQKNIRKNEPSVTKNDLLKVLKNMGIQSGDVLMVHASWRSFYKFDGNPEDVIDVLLDIIGENGTLLMPCFGDDLTFFDVKNTPSKAGVLSETFRKMSNVSRSESSHFSVCGCGAQANLILNTHKFSEFGFDQYSPYFRFVQYPNSKILHLGLGKYPIKTTLIHCIEYIFKDKYPYFNNYLSEKYRAIVIDKDGIKQKRKMIKGTYAKLNRRNITKLYKNIPTDYKKYEKLSNIDIRLINGNIGFEILKKMTMNGITMLKPPYKNKNSFKVITNR